MSEVQASAVEQDTEVTPEPIMQLGLGFWGSKTLLTAVELGLFGVLHAGAPPTAPRRGSASTPRSRPTSSMPSVALGHARSR